MFLTSAQQNTTLIDFTFYTDTLEQLNINSYYSKLMTLLMLKCTDNQRELKDIYHMHAFGIWQNDSLSVYDSPARGGVFFNGGKFVVKNSTEIKYGVVKFYQEEINRLFKTFFSEGLYFVNNSSKTYLDMQAYASAIKAPSEPLIESVHPFYGLIGGSAINPQIDLGLWSGDRVFTTSEEPSGDYSNGLDLIFI